ncbi:MAG: hypothetical protein RIN55_12505 [Tissierellaceae bacterium]|nr:hypothetical protein [Tissierellaceae bacterium]
MKLYNELEVAIEEVMIDIDESRAFKNRFSKFIERFYERSYSISDLEDTIELIENEQED